MIGADWKKGWILPAAVAAAVALAYLPTLSFPFVFDDRTNIVDNPALRPEVLAREGAGHFFTGQPPSGAHRPVANATFLLNLRLGGSAAGGFRAVNILIHAVNVLLAFFLFQRVLALARGSLAEGTRSLLALVAAGLWGASPLHAESVTYIVQRETALSGTFFLGGCLLVLRWWERREVPASGWALAGAGGCLLLSAGAKETGVLLPFAAALLILLLGGETRGARVVPLALLGAGALLAGGAALLYRPDLLSWHQGSFAEGYGPWERVLTQGRVLWWYAGLILLPLPSRQSIDVEFPVSGGLLDPVTTLPAWLAWIALGAWAWRGRRDEPLLSLALLWFLLLSSLEASPLHLEIAFIHRTYLPMLFLPLALVEGGWALAGKPALRKALGAGCAGLFLVLLGLTAARNTAFASEVSLWRDAVAKSPGKERPRFNLGKALEAAGDRRGAAEQYREAIRIVPRYYRPYAALALMLEQEGEVRAAMGLMNDAYELAGGTDGAVLYNLGRYLYQTGDHDRAERLFREALPLASLASRGDAWWYLALIAQDRGDASGAAAAWEKAAQEYGPGSERGRAALARRQQLR